MTPGTARSTSPGRRPPTAARRSRTTRSTGAPRPGGESLLTTVGNVTILRRQHRHQRHQLLLPRLGGERHRGGNPVERGLGHARRPSITVNDVSHPRATPARPTTPSRSSLRQPELQPVTVAYATQDGTATTAGSDYVAASARSPSAAGQTSKTVTVKVNGDTTFEPDEGFTRQALRRHQRHDRRRTGAGHDPERRLRSRRSRSTTSRHAGGQLRADGLHLHGVALEPELPDRHRRARPRTAPPHRRLRLRALASATLTFTPGQTSKTVTVNVNGDTKFEPDEAFTLRCRARPTPRSPTTPGGTIQNDDAAAADLGQRRLPGGGQRRHRRTSPSRCRCRTRARSRSRSTCQTQDGTATAADSDYAGARAAPAHVPARPDHAGPRASRPTATPFEPDETFSARCSRRRPTPRSPTTPASARSRTTTPQPAISVDDVAHPRATRARPTSPSRSRCPTRARRRSRSLRHAGRHRATPAPTTPRRRARYLRPPARSPSR